MSGSIHRRHDGRAWYVKWYFPHLRKGVNVTRYRGLICETKNMASKLLSAMQGDVENGVSSRGLFRKYKLGETDTIPYLWDWLESVRGNLSPATYKDYANSIKNHLEPFFKQAGCQLSEIQYDTLQRLQNSIDRTPKGIKNVMYCLHTCLDYAWRSSRIPAVPPFPRIRVQEPTIKWLPELRQIKIISAISEEHQPIFWWLKYHLRRPCEAMALQWEDYDESTDCFIIRRSVSARKVVQRTKTGKESVIPCHSEFKQFMHRLRHGFSPFIFTNPRSRYKGRRYSHGVLSKMWQSGCKRAGESIRMYAGLKHSTASQMINESGYSLDQVQRAGDWKSFEAVKRYAATEIEERRRLLERKVVSIQNMSKDDLKTG